MPQNARDRHSGSSTLTAFDREVDTGSSTPTLQDSPDRLPKKSPDSNGFDIGSVDTLFHVLNTEVDKRLTQGFTDTDSLRPRTPTQPTLKLSRYQRESVSVNDAEKAKPGPPVPVGFWHHSLTQTRKEVARKYSGTLFVLCVAVIGILSIYWGIIYDVKRNMPRIVVSVVSFEGLSPYQDIQPVVGPFVRNACEEDIASRYDHLGYRFDEPSRYGNDPVNVRLAVYHQEIWAAIIINSNATALLTEAVLNGNKSYDPTGAVTIIYNQARDVESYNFHITPILDALALRITTTFASYWANSVLNNNTYSASTYSAAPQALSPGISPTLLNLRPFDPPVAIPTITIGLIYLIIIAFFSFTFFIPTHMKFILPNPKFPHPPLKFSQLIIYRWCATITAYLFLSLAYSLVSLAFRIPFSHSPPNGGSWSKTEPVFNANPLGHGTWPAYWMLNFFGMAALGLTCENMAMLLSALSPLPYSALFLIWWVITNVSTGFYAIELASDFYKWGYAWPLRHIVEGSKTLVFGTKNQLGLNFGVLFAWTVVGTMLFPVACWVMRWKVIQDKKKAAAATAAASTGNLEQKR